MPAPPVMVRASVVPGEGVAKVVAGDCQRARPRSNVTVLTVTRHDSSRAEVLTGAAIVTTARAMLSVALGIVARGGAARVGVIERRHQRRPRVRSRYAN